MRAALLDVAKPSLPAETDISDIVLTHRHHDHCNGLPSVLALLHQLWDSRNPTRGTGYAPPRIHKLPLPPNAPDAALDTLVHALPPALFTPATLNTRLHALTDGKTLACADGTALEVLHTPGHTPDSVCLHLAADRALFTGDTVLGGSTSVFEDLATYLASLRRMLAFRVDGEAHAYNALYPGHGPVVPDGVEMIEMYVKHRLEREARILELLGVAPTTSAAPSSVDPHTGPGQQWTVWDIVKTMYKGYPENLWEPAAHGVALHLRKLEGEGRVRRVSGEGKEGIWEVIG